MTLLLHQNHTSHNERHTSKHMTVDRYVAAGKKAYKSYDGNAHIEMHHSIKQNQSWKHEFMISNVE